MTQGNGQPALVNIKIDGKAIQVPAGTNIIEAASGAGIDIPHYCYHPNLTIAGNCRMCQVEVKGMKKLEIACNMVAREGLEVSTHHTSQTVKDTQAATLEFLLINHPLDCTVCDQAGHCKLQDYHFEYNAHESRFLEEKVHKVKAEPLGPNVVLDGERCILCTRCVRFCEEVTKTGELGILNRGDKGVISINAGHELNNALSGTVVDLCPVGALTHRPWRFNSRIWFTKQTDTICPGCSTGCNCKIAIRDRNEIVHVKARVNQEVNKEWMCDEGRYGMERFLPKNRMTLPLLRGRSVQWDEALREASAKLKSQPVLIFVAPQLLTEEYFLLKTLIAKHLKSATVAVAYRERKLSAVEAVLISPDYAANFRGAEFSGLVSGNLEAGYDDALTKFRAGGFQQVLFVGDRSIAPEDINPQFLSALAASAMSIALISDGDSTLAAASKVVLPARSVLEKSGLLVNRAGRLQYAERSVDFPTGSEPEWRILNRLAEKLGQKVTNASSDRELTLSLLASQPALAGLRISTIKQGGVDLNTYRPQEKGEDKASSSVQVGA